MGKIDRSLKLNNRERMIRVCLNEDIDRLPFWFVFGPWGKTVDRWRAEGLETDYGTWASSAGFDVGFRHVHVNLGFEPFFEYKIINEDESKRTVRNQFGITLTEFKSSSTIPQFIDYPVKNRSDWLKIKNERLDPDSPERFPADYHKSIKKIKESGAAAQVGSYPYGLFGTLRDFMGAENLLLAFYDDPGLIREMMDYLTDFWIAIYKKILGDVQLDHIHIWEDMSGKQGPLISPAMFREFMTPNYKKITAFAKENGIAVISVDTDGNMDVMMPLLSEAGINMVFPFEVQAGCDVVAIKKQYPDICLNGGIDKRALALGRDAIDGELERVAELFETSGYIPGLDHLPHPEISFQNYVYFTERLKEMIFKV